MLSQLIQAEFPPKLAASKIIHLPAGRAKDIASAAVFISIINAVEIGFEISVLLLECAFFPGISAQ